MQALIWILGILVFVRLMLPIAALAYINQALKKNEKFRGHVGRLKLNLIGSTVYLREIQGSMVDQASGIDSLKLTIDHVDISVRVAALFRRIVDATVTVHNPDIIYANVISKAKPEKASQIDNGHSSLQPSPLKSALESAVPFGVQLTILNGRIRYIDHTSDARIDVKAEGFHLKVSNFSNIPARASVPAKIDAIATVYQGKCMLTMDLKPLEQYLTFALKLSLKEVSMPLLNNFFQSFAKIDVNDGKLSMFAELAAEKGVFNGYIKPVFRDLTIIGVEDKNDSFFKRMWERLVAFVVRALENNKLDQIATVIPVAGRFDRPQVNVLAAIGGVLKNAFVQGLRPSFENAVGFRSIVKTALSDPGGFFIKCARMINAIQSYR
jgi:hypothetical protein